MPFLLGLACASNIGSAATLIGNPQNMLIGEVLKMPFAGYAQEAIGPVVAGLLALWALLAGQMRRTPPVAEPDPAQLAALTAGCRPSTAGRPPRAWAWRWRWSGVPVHPTGRAMWPHWPARACCC